MLSGAVFKPSNFKRSSAILELPSGSDLHSYRFSEVIQLRLLFASVRSSLPIYFYYCATQDVFEGSVELAAAGLS